jgi:hypothetical protein
MARPTTVALTEDERKKFDNIGLDDINAMTDVNQLNKLAKYMECVSSLPASRFGSASGPNDPGYGSVRACAAAFSVARSSVSLSFDPDSKTATARFSSVPRPD